MMACVVGGSRSLQFASSWRVGEWEGLQLSGNYLRHLPSWTGCSFLSSVGRAGTSGKYLRQVQRVGWNFQRRCDRPLIGPLQGMIGSWRPEGWAPIATLQAADAATSCRCSV